MKNIPKDLFKPNNAEREHADITIVGRVKEEPKKQGDFFVFPVIQKTTDLEFMIVKSKISDLVSYGSLVNVKGSLGTNQGILFIGADSVEVLAEVSDINLNEQKVSNEFKFTPEIQEEKPVSIQEEKPKPNANLNSSETNKSNSEGYVPIFKKNLPTEQTKETSSEKNDPTTINRNKNLENRYEDF